MNIQGYVGSYTVRQGSTNKVGLALEAGDVLHIGTGSFNTTPPVVGNGPNGDGSTVGMTAWRGSQQIFPTTPNTDGTMTMVNGNLVWDGMTGTPAQATRVQFTLAHIAGDGGWNALYGCTIDIDPQVVGAWGAHDRP